MKEILFSIVMPVYNSEKYLKRSISSILNQTYNDFELILVNDGSTDKSANICEEFLKKDKRIKIINQTNQRATKARINGIKKARGKYICSMDSDDYLNNNSLEILKNIIEKNSPDMIMFRYNILNEKNKIVNKLSPFDLEGFTSKKNFYYKILNDSRLNSVVLKIVKRNKIDLEYLEKLESINMGDDLLITTIFLKNIETIFLTNNILYNYCYNSNSIVHTFKKDTINETFYLINHLHYYVKSFLDEKLESYFYKLSLKMILNYIIDLSKQDKIYFLEKKEIFNYIRKKKKFIQSLGYYDKSFLIKHKIVYFLFKKEYDIFMVSLIKISYRLKCLMFAKA